MDSLALGELQARTFQGLLAATDPASGLIADRWPSPSACSIGAQGFAFTVWAIAAARGWMSRSQAVDLTLKGLRTLSRAPQGDSPSGVAGHRGWFYHFLNRQTGLRAGTCELSTIDTALMLAGALAAARAFDGEGPEEVELRQLTAALYEAVDWAWATTPSGRIALGWTPEAGFIPYEWRGYNEAMILYILALGADYGPMSPSAWTAWTEDYRRSWTTWPVPHLAFGPMFGHQYSHLWIDFRGIQDAFMRELKLDYFENSRRAVVTQQAYAAANPGGWGGYSADFWGLTACDGPGDFRQLQGLRLRRFRSYAARGAHDFDDGTLAPTAMAASLPFSPEIVLPSLERLIDAHGRAIYGPQGLQDAFNPTLTRPTPPAFGAVQPGTGWVSHDMLGIDQGPIVAMIENHRTGLVWRWMRGEPVIQRGLQRAGFTGGWLA
ncbi:MAG: glucoamylase family protein [Caulobacter sp.]|nr:glucoamylase family protein [Caulobacter sp.]